MKKNGQSKASVKSLLGAGELASVLLRSFTIQASWNYERMLGLGFLFSILPGLRVISRDGDVLKEKAERHFEFFNAHPYMAGYALGSSLRFEEEYLAGAEADEESFRRGKKRLFTTLGSLGDNLIWKSWRPLCGVLGVLLSYLTGWLGPLVYLIIYNMLHFYVRITGLFHSYYRGREALTDFDGFLYRKLPSKLEATICILLGSMTVILLRGESVNPASWGARTIFLLLIVAFWVLLKHFTPRFLLYLTSIILTFGLLFWEIVIGK